LGKKDTTGFELQSVCSEKHFEKAGIKGGDTLVRLLLGRGSAEIYTIREVFDMLESKKSGCHTQVFPEGHIFSGRISCILMLSATRFTTP
jgi:hypothetical protein